MNRKKIILELPNDLGKHEIEAPENLRTLKQKLLEYNNGLEAYNIYYYDEMNDQIIISDDNDYNMFLESNNNIITFKEKMFDSNFSNTITTNTIITNTFSKFGTSSKVINIYTELENKNKEINDLQNTLNKNKNELENKNKEINDLQNKLNENKNELENKNKEINDLQNTLNENKNELEKAKNKINKLNERKQQLKKDLEEKDIEINKLQKRKEKLKNKLENFKKSAEKQNINVNEDFNLTDEQSIKIDRVLNDDQYIKSLSLAIEKKPFNNNNFNEYIQKEITNACDNIAQNLYKKNEEFLKEQINQLISKEDERIKLFKSLLNVHEKKPTKEIINNENDEIIHIGFICEFCKISPIIGIRYKCENCSNFNLCEICYKKLNSTKEYSHIDNHKFISRNYSTEFRKK